MIVLFAQAEMAHAGFLTFLALAFGLYMAWNIGANDVANAMGTSVGSKAISLKQAVIIAAVMELAGAVLVGMHVTDTVRKGIFDPTLFEPAPLVLGFLGALLAAGIWLQVATYFGWPVSTTHSIVGAVVGVGVVIGGMDAVNWGRVGSIILSWITSPVCGGLVSFFFFKLFQRRIFDRERPLREAYRLLPFLVAYVGFVLTLVMVFKGLKNLKLDLDLKMALVVSTLFAAAFFGVAVAWLKRSRIKHEKERAAADIPAADDGDGGSKERLRRFETDKVEGLFTAMLILSACFLAFAHGANDVANAIGPVAAVVEIAKTGAVAVKSQVSIGILLLGGVGIVVGLATWGYRVIETVGRKITELTPSRGFAVNIGAAKRVVLASRLGFPISTTHTMIGALLGVGLARGVDSLNLRMLRDIGLSWIITIPAGAGLAVLNYFILRALFGA